MGNALGCLRDGETTFRFAEHNGWGVVVQRFVQQEIVDVQPSELLEARFADVVGPVIEERGPSRRIGENDVASEHILPLLALPNEDRKACRVSRQRYRLEVWRNLMGFRNVASSSDLPPFRGVRCILGMHVWRSPQLLGEFAGRRCVGVVAQEMSRNTTRLGENICLLSIDGHPVRSMEQQVFPG